ncbi:MAG: twin-arginine translocation signal domain-containing protein [Acidobacteria bacterium]|nr:twin-arginine translocation signal domain-containing protein [Acidobacteriota bacterium]
MSDTKLDITRRDFLRDAAAAAIAAGLAGSSAAEGAATAPGPAVAGEATVVLVRDAAVLDAGGKPVASVLSRMLDQAMAELTGKADPVAAWGSLFRASDTVGIKTNVWQYLRTPPELEQATHARLVGAGVAAGRIAIDDRGVLRNPVFQSATALVNVRPMRTHHWSGVGSLLKNYIMFDEEPSRWHGDSCADLGGLWKLPLVAGKTRLNILVLLTPLFHSTGPHDYTPRYVWPYRGLLVGTDPVAVDATGLRIIEAQRRAHFGNDAPLDVPPKHIRVAADKHKLGIADPARIRLRKLGLAEGALI